MPAIPIGDVLFYDIETHSAADLRKVGSWRYAEHPTTDAWMVCWAIGDGPIETWYPGEVVPPAVAEHARLGRYFSAHNVGFEYPVTNLLLARRHGWPKLLVEQMHDTAAECAAMALPRALEDAGRELGLQVQKDREGHALMLRMARPRRIDWQGCIACRGVVGRTGCRHCGGSGHGYVWWNEPARIERLAAYCGRDVAVAREVFKRVRRLPPDERLVFELDQVVNETGVRVDQRLARALHDIVERAKEDLDAEMAEVTGGTVRKCSNATTLQHWLTAQGVPTDSVAKPAVTRMLLDPATPPRVRRALELRRTAAKSSTAKLATMGAAVCGDGHLKGMFLYHGANTGRWSGKLVQLHNLVRKSPPGSIEMAVEVAVRHGYDGVLLMYGDPMGFASSMLRPCLIPDDGDEMYTADLSQIEARMVAGLAGEQRVLDVFAAGEDIYCHAASGIFGREVTKKNDGERQVGKVSVLSLGYQGGPVAFSAMARNYNVDIAAAHDTVMAAATAEQVERAGWGWERYRGTMTEKAYVTADLVKQAWREANPAIVAYWRECEDAVIRAVETRRPAKARDVTFQVVPIAGRDYLWARLPSSRLLCYTDPKLCTVRTPWGAARLAVVASSVDSRTKRWTRRTLYGGLLVENLVQAAARDVLVAGMMRLVQAGYRIVGHVHDEAIVTTRKGRGDRDHIRRMMVERTDWMAKLGLPVDADVSPPLNRYRK